MPTKMIVLLDMGGVEVEAPYLRVRAGGGGEQRGQPVAAAEIGVAEGFGRVGGQKAEQGRAGGEPGRSRFQVGADRVGDIGDVSVIPSRHERGHPFLVVGMVMA